MIDPKSDRAVGRGKAGCAVCGAQASSGARMSRVVVEGRTLELCRTHAASVAAAMPETFDQLRRLFAGFRIDAPAPRTSSERRSPLTRRAPEDRRVFPPRPEGRRQTTGRRETDPTE